MSIVGLYSRIQSIENMVNELKVSGTSGGSEVSNTSIPEEKVVDLTQFSEFNELKEKIKMLEVADGELSNKFSEVSSMLNSYVPLSDFSGMNSTLDNKLENLVSHIDKLNNAVNTLYSKVTALEEKLS
jgi:predicted nuclease with TOPRIM domain